MTNDEFDAAIKELGTVQIVHSQGQFKASAHGSTHYGDFAFGALGNLLRASREVQAPKGSPAYKAPAVNHLYSNTGGEIPQAGQDY